MTWIRKGTRILHNREQVGLPEGEEKFYFTHRLVEPPTVELRVAQKMS